MTRSLHPLAWWIWAGSLAIAIARASSVLLAVVVVGVVAVVVAQKSENAPWAKSFAWALKIGIWVIAIRTITGMLIGTPIPGRTIFSLPIIPLPSWMAGIRIGGPVTLERLSLTFHEGILLACIIAVLGAAASLSSPHRLLRALPVMVYEFGVAVVIATSVLPELVVSFYRIREAQRLRGQNLRGIKSWKRIAMPLLEDSLSRSLELASAMDSRGYGFSRKRSRYRPEKWQISEYLICLIAITAIFVPIAAILAPLAALFIAPVQRESVTR